MAQPEGSPASTLEPLGTYERDGEEPEGPEGWEKESGN